MTKKLFLLLLLIFCCYSSLLASDLSSVEKLIERRVPWLNGKVSFVKIPAENNKDVFTLSTKNNKLLIEASSPSAASFGLNWYLKYFCHRSMSHLGDNLAPVKVLSKIENKIHKTAELPLRYALNYCTINYTMSFYGWKEWERELDWMALNGVNLMLMPVGTEAVWQNTLRKLGFTEKEILDFIPGPAFTAWWLMGNLEGWGGNVSQTMIDQQATLAKQILKRMKELGIQPVGQGFYGMVPTTLKQKQSIKIIPQGKWAGGFQRPDFLLPEDPYFVKISDIFYQEYKKLYGSDIRYFGGDPFHEGGKTQGINVKESASIIQRQMQKNYPGSVWVLQGWQKNPSDQLLAGLDKSKSIVIELFGENTKNWDVRKGFNDTPFIWGTINNFGGRSIINGKLQHFADEIYRAANSAYSGNLKGIGILPEGIDNNPVDYDLMMELAWHKEKLDVKEWIRDYVRYRYGTNNEKLQKAWQIFFETSYSSPDIFQDGISESILCARPGIDLKSASKWGTRTRNYDFDKFAEGVGLFAAAEKEIPVSETYKTDKVDFLRQANANKADRIYTKMSDAAKNNDETNFKALYAEFEKILIEQDKLMGESPFFSLSTWLNQAENFGKTPSDKKLAVSNARTLISYWGPDNPQTELRDYSYREWNGLISTLYLPRWRKFAENTVKRMHKQPVEDNYFQMEKSWAEGKY